MLIAVVACVLGIILENRKWPQDRSALEDRFIASERPAEKLRLLVGLVLNHSLVRWLISFGAAAVVAVAILANPSLQSRIHDALADGRLGKLELDAALGVFISTLMTLFAVVARRIAS
jgi:hypothetical protein